MTTIQAFNRTKLYTHVFPDVTLVFKPNVLGDVVCDVESESAVERLLRVPTAFRPYHTVEDAQPVAAPAPMRAFTLDSVISAFPTLTDVVVPAQVPAAPLVATPEGDKGGNIATPAAVNPPPTEPVAPPPAPPVPAPAPPANPGHDFVLRDPEGGTFDLKPLDDAALREFATANGINIHHAAKGDTIRMRIVAALMAPKA